MSRWFRLYDEFLVDPKIQRLHPSVFKEEFFRALKGEPSAFDGFVTGPFYRPPIAEWAVLRATVFERDSYTCTYCGARGVALECDHIDPVSKGGASDLANLTTACLPCNRSKGNKTLAEWRG